MAISRFYDKTATTQREGFVSGSDIKKAFANHLSSFPCHVQPLEASLHSTIPGSFGKNWVMFCNVMDINEGDKVTVGTSVYRVIGIETFDMSGDPHLEVVMKSFKE